MHIRVGHVACGDHTLFPFAPKRRLQQLRRVPLDLNILKGMGKLIAPAPAVAVDAAVGAAPVNIHAPAPSAAGEDSLGIHKVHGVSSYGAPGEQGSRYSASKWYLGWPTLFLPYSMGSAGQ